MRGGLAGQNSAAPEPLTFKRPSIPSPKSLLRTCLQENGRPLYPGKAGKPRPGQNTGRSLSWGTFQILLEPSVGSETANPEAVRKNTPCRHTGFSGILTSSSVKCRLPLRPVGASPPAALRGGRASPLRRKIVGTCCLPQSRKRSGVQEPPSSHMAPYKAKVSSTNISYFLETRQPSGWTCLGSRQSGGHPSLQPKE